MDRFVKDVSFEHNLVSVTTMLLPREMMILIFINLGMKEQLTTVSLLSRKFRSLVDEHPLFLQHLHLLVRYGQCSDFRRARSRPRSLTISFVLKPFVLDFLPASWNLTLAVSLESVQICGHIPIEYLSHLQSIISDVFRFHKGIADHFVLHLGSCSCFLNTLQQSLPTGKQVHLTHPTALYKPWVHCPSCSFVSGWWKECSLCLKVSCSHCGKSQGCWFLCGKCRFL